jgi:steroid delta-isomerase
MFNRCLGIFLCLFAAGATATSARADPDADRAAITERLQRWAAAFNARDASGVCDLFAPSLVSTVPGALDGSRDAVCTRLAALLAKPDLQLHYSPDIREIIVSGDIAVVRLFWTLTTQTGADRDVSREAGMDIFERQPDGTWSIVRFLAFTVEPDAKR